MKNPYISNRTRRKHKDMSSEELAQAMASFDKSKITKLPDGPKPKEWCEVKSKDRLNNGAKISPEENWLIGGKRLK